MMFNLSCLSLRTHFFTPLDPLPFPLGTEPEEVDSGELREFDGDPPES